MVGTVTFSAKRSKLPTQWFMQYAVGTQCAVGISPERSTHTVYLANMGGGELLPLVQKGQTPCSGYAVRSGTQCAVGVGAKRSTGTVDLANMGGGDRYL